MSNTTITILSIIAIDEYQEDHHCHWGVRVILNPLDYKSSSVGMEMQLDHNEELLLLNYFYPEVHHLIPQIDNKTLSVRVLMMDLFTIWKETSHLWNQRKGECYINYNHCIPYTRWELTFDKIEDVLHFRNHPCLKAHYHYQPDGLGYQESKKDFYDKVSINQ